MAEMKGGEVLMECLANQGPSPLFSIADGGYNVIFDWAHHHSKERGIRFITPRHEAAGAHMADGYYRVTGKPAIVVAGAGPGVANVISGAITAAGEETAMIVITNSRRSDLIAPLRGAMQTFEQVRTLAQFCKYSMQVTRIERIPAAIEVAYKLSLSGIPGPVHIDFPEDVLGMKINAAGIKFTPKIDLSLASASSQADPAAIEEAAKMLVNAKEAVVHCGATVVRSGAWNELLELIEYLGMPVTTSPSGRGAIREDHPNSFPPVCGLARAAMAQSDVLLAVGCKFGELDFYGQPPLFGLPSSQKLIHIHRSLERIGLNRYADVPVLGDASLVLKQLLDKVKELTPKREPHKKIKQYQDLKLMWESELTSKYCKPGARMNTGNVVTVAREFFSRDTIFAQDGGNTSMWTANFIRILEPRTLLWTADFGQLGTGVPFAIGGKVAAPDKNVCLISGDGAVGFNLMELETARRNDLPIVCIIAADYAWGMEKTSQQRCFGHDKYYVNVEHHPIRYDKIAEAMDCFGAYVDKTEDLKPALKAAVESKVPAVIHAAVDPEANVFPPGHELWAATHAAK